MAISYFPVDTAYLRVESDVTDKYHSRSDFPVDPAHLRAEIGDWNITDKYYGRWVNKKRICMNDDYSRTDCVIETTFRYDIQVVENSQFFCGYENAESESLHVQVMNTSKIVRVHTVLTYFIFFFFFECPQRIFSFKLLKPTRILLNIRGRPPEI